MSKSIRKSGNSLLFWGYIQGARKKKVCWMLNDLAFSITRNRKPQTKNPKTQKPQTKTQLDWVFLKEPPQKNKKKTKWFFMFCESWVFFGKNLYKMWMIFIILQSWVPWKNLMKNAINFHILKSHGVFPLA
jgi:hypothetical protein